MSIRAKPIHIVVVGNSYCMLPTARHVDALERRQGFTHQRRRVLDAGGNRVDKGREGGGSVIASPDLSVGKGYCCRTPPEGKNIFRTGTGRLRELRK